MDEQHPTTEADEQALIFEVRRALNADIARAHAAKGLPRGRTRNLLIGVMLFLTAIVVLPLFLAPALLKQSQDKSSSTAKTSLAQFSFSQRGQAADEASVKFVQKHAVVTKVSDGSGSMWALTGGTQCWGVMVTTSGLVGQVQEVERHYCHH